MKKLFLIISFGFHIISFSQTTPTMRQVASAGTTITKLPATATSTVSATDTMMVFKNGIWQKTKVSAIASGGGAVTSVSATSPLSSTGGATPTISITSPLPIVNGGTNNSLAYTSGSVIFSDGIKLTENNSNLFWDNGSNRLGIGTVTPETMFHVDEGQSTFVYGDQDEPTLILRAPSNQPEGNNSTIAFKDFDNTNRWQIGRWKESSDPLLLQSNAFVISNFEFNSGDKGFTPFQIDTNSKIFLGRHSADVEDDLTLPVADVTVFSPNTTTGKGNLFVCTTDAFAINKGGAISLGGQSGQPLVGGTEFATIAGRKTTSGGGSFGGYMTFSTNANPTMTERMRITSTGFIGINQTAPDARLHINGSSGTTIKIVDGNEGAAKVLTSDANGQGSWQAIPGVATPTLAQVLTAGRLVDGTGTIASSLGSAAIDFNNRTLGAGAVKALDWTNRILYASNGSSPRINWENKLMSENWQIDGSFSPLTDNSNDLGTATEGWANLYMASDIHYTSNLEFKNAAATKAILTTTGKFGLGTTPVASSIMELSSTTSGLLIPRMTTAQKNAIAAPAMSLTVFDTDLGQFYFHDGITWIAITKGTNQFIQNGNVFGADAVLGTNDAFDLIFETNATEKMRLTSAGDLGIGITPSRKLHVTGGTSPAARFLSTGATQVTSLELHNTNTDEVGVGSKIDFLVTSPTPVVITYASISGDAVLNRAADSQKRGRLKFIVRKGADMREDYVIDEDAVSHTWGLNGVSNMMLTNVGLRIGSTSSPTSYLHLAAGTTAASTAPVKFTSGSLMTAAEAGAVEFLTDDAYLTITTGTARQKIGRVLTGSATLNFANQAVIGCNDLTITVTGAVDGDEVSIGVPNGSVPNGTAYFTAWVSAANTVTVRYCQLVSGDPASGTFQATVIKN